jgi:hypothetical protein
LLVSCRNPPISISPADRGLTLGLLVPRIAAVTQTSLANSLNSRTIGQASLAFQVLYAFSIILSKGALLLLYLRVFTSQMKKFTLTLLIVAFIVLTTGTSYAFVAIFQCSPVSFAWDKGISSGKCVDFGMVAKWLSIPNVVDGLVMLTMPIPVVWALAIETQQKIALTATFFHGIMYAPLPLLSPLSHLITNCKYNSGFISSIVRLVYLSRRGPLTNTASLILTLFTLLEPSNYIIAACLPTLRPIFIRILPESVFILSRKRNSSSNPKSPTSPTANGNEKQSWGSSTVKWSWSKGSLTPKISLVSRGRSQLSGPWDGGRWEGEREQVPMTARGEWQKGKGVSVREEEVEAGIAC